MEDLDGVEDPRSDGLSTETGSSPNNKSFENDTSSESGDLDASGSPKQATSMQSPASEEIQRGLALLSAPSPQTAAPGAQHTQDAKAFRNQMRKEKTKARKAEQREEVKTLLLLDKETEKALHEAQQAQRLAEEQARQALKDVQAAEKAAQEQSKRAQQAVAALLEKEIQVQRLAQSNLAMKQEWKKAEKQLVVADLQGQLQVAKGQLCKALQDLQQARAEATSDREAWNVECHQAQKAFEKLRNALAAKGQWLQEEEQAFAQPLLPENSAMGSLKATVQGLWHDLSDFLTEARAQKEVLRSLREEKVELEQSLGQAEEDRRSASGEAGRLKQETEDWKQQFQMTTEQLSSIRKDLGERLLCPISFQPMCEPVMGSDLRTYQKEAIEQALNVKESSPFTRLFMDKGSLRPNLVVADFVDIMTRHFPDWEATTSPLRRAPVPPVRDELVNAIRHRNSDQAVELLSRDVDDDLLNGGLIYKSTTMNLLQLCISGNLPRIALAVINRPDFRRAESFSDQGILAIHMAAAYNFTDVCRRIVKDVGGYALSARTLHDVQLADPSGHSVLIPKGSNAVDCARLFGHQPDWAQD